MEVKIETKNPYLYSSFNWYEFELKAIFPECKQVKQSRGYSFWVDNILVDCKSDNKTEWKIIKIKAQ